jgi:hypothetical protein
MRDAGDLGLIHDSQLRSQLAFYYESSANRMADIMLMNLVPQYRQDIRSVTPMPVQEYIWAHCFRILPGSARDQRLRYLDIRLRLARHRGRLEQLSGRLSQLSPLAILERGYAIVTGASGAIVKDSAAAPPGSRVRVRLARGGLEADVTRSE